MDSILDFLQQCFYIFLFCAGLAFLFRIDSSASLLLAAARENINENSVMYAQRQEKEENEVAYEEIIAMLLQELPYDVVIDGRKLKAETFDPIGFDFGLIREIRYQESYTYHADGTIQEVIYNSRGS